MANFNTVPTIHAPRSKFDLSYSVKTSGNVGTLYPCMVQEIYPGDSFNVDTSFVARLSSSYLRPVMDNLFIDFYYFFVPSRLVFDDFTSIFGENKTSAWAQDEPVSAPVIDTSQIEGALKIPSKSVCDYMGLPVGVQIPGGWNILPVRAFAKIYDDWWRDENIIDPMLIHTGDFVAYDETPNNEEWSPSNYFGKCPKVAKFHDIFTSALPSTQKSTDPVQIPIGRYAPIVAPTMDITPFSSSGTPALFQTNVGISDQNVGLFLNGVAGAKALKGNVIDAPSGTSMLITGSNLHADLSEVGLFSVPDLRYAFQLQRLLERSARSGTRYTEYLLSAFGVKSPDSRLQRSEYLGGKRIPLSTQQVAQTTRGTEDDELLGSLGAFSLSNGKTGYNKGFVEHGFVIGCFCIRQHHTYQQGIEKFWHRSQRFDYYDPALANISEQPVFTSELFAHQQAQLDTDVFGYQEAWYDLRYRPSHVTGDMRTNSETSLDIWHYADWYENQPYLTPSFINETPTYVDRTIAVPSTSMDQFILDIYHRQSAIRCLPTYSVPGLIDHN